MNTFSINDQLVMLIDRLNTAVNVCYEAPKDEATEEHFSRS